VPADNSLGLHNDENIAPAGPTTVESRPEEAVHGIQRRPRSFTFENGDLLPEGEDLKGRIAPTPEEDTDHGEDGENEFGHEITLVAWRNLIRQQQRRLAQLIDHVALWSSDYRQPSGMCHS
jgi:hypothetical protein